jgi:hypothetical protein
MLINNNLWPFTFRDMICKIFSIFLCNEIVCILFSTKGGLTLHQGNNWQQLQHFLVMTGNITKKCCRQHVANCCLGVRPSKARFIHLQVTPSERQ